MALPYTLNKRKRLRATADCPNWYFYRHFVHYFIMFINSEHKIIVCKIKLNKNINSLLTFVH